MVKKNGIREITLTDRIYIDKIIANEAKIVN